MTKWYDRRPEGWKNPYSYWQQCSLTSAGMTMRALIESRYTSFEDGAGTMHKADIAEIKSIKNPHEIHYSGHPTMNNAMHDAVEEFRKMIVAKLEGTEQ